MYHYIRDFPHAVAHGAKFAQGDLQRVLLKYAREEEGHEEFVLRTLMNLGMSRAEVMGSVPLLSTRLVGFLMREIFAAEPASVFLVAAVIEAQEFAENQIRTVKKAFSTHYSIPESTFDPYFDHQRIDVGLGHAQLLERHAGLFTCRDIATLDSLVNKVHDLKHAFDLQSLEIKQYFNKLDGKYCVRQPVGYEDLVLAQA
jgi:hypothetical protein